MPTLFFFETLVSLFESVRQSLAPLLADFDSVTESNRESIDTVLSAEQVAEIFGKLPMERTARHVGACLCASTNLGLAYSQGLDLMRDLHGNGDMPLVKNSDLDLVAKFEALPASSQGLIGEIFDSVSGNDFDVELSTRPFSDEPRDSSSTKAPSPREMLRHLRRNMLIHAGYRSLQGSDENHVIQIFVPLKSMHVLDQLLAKQIAPKLGRTYKTIAEHTSSPIEIPMIKWENGSVSVSLPDMLGRTIQAEWTPDVTSVIRIRKRGSDEWSAGFETPIYGCSFVGLSPNTEYEVQVTHKSDAGESEPSVEKITTK